MTCNRCGDPLYDGQCKNVDCSRYWEEGDRFWTAEYNRTVKRAAGLLWWAVGGVLALLVVALTGLLLHLLQDRVA